MSYPRWPQSAFFYRPRNVPAVSPYGEYVAQLGDYVPGFGSFGPKTQGLTYGSLSPKYDWSTPRYIRREPTGLDGFGGFGSFGEAVNLGCLGDVREKATSGLMAILDKISAGQASGMIGSFLKIRDRVAGALNGLENAMLARTEAGWPEVKTGIVTFMMDAVPNMRTGNDSIDSFLDPGVLGEQLADYLKGELDACAQQQGVLPTVTQQVTEPGVLPTVTQQVTEPGAPLAQAYLVTSRFIKRETVLPKILTSRFLPKKKKTAAKASPVVLMAAAAAALFLLMKK